MAWSSDLLKRSNIRCSQQVGIYGRILNFACEMFGANSLVSSLVSLGGHHTHDIGPWDYLMFTSSINIQIK